MAPVQITVISMAAARISATLKRASASLLPILMRFMIVVSELAWPEAAPSREMPHQMPLAPLPSEPTQTLRPRRRRLE